MRRCIASLVIPFALLVPAQTAHAATIRDLTSSAEWWAQTGASPVSNGPWATSWGPQPYAAPAVGDLLGNGSMDVVTAYPDGSVHAYSAGGQALPGWPKRTGGAIYGSPTLVDLRGDGMREVFVASKDGWVYGWNADGSNVPGWPQFGGYGHSVASNFLPGFVSSVAAGDLFGDGHTELVATSLDHYLYAWNSSGGVLPGFPINLWDTAVDTPALADLQHTGRLDIIAGGDSAPGHRNGVWYAFPPTGCSSPNASLSGCALPGWPQYTDEVPWSSPAAADEYNNGSQEIVAGSGHYYHQTGCGGCGLSVHAWNAGGGALAGWPAAVASPVFGSVAVGDLGNGQRDVVAVTENNRLQAWNPQGQTLFQSDAAHPVTGLGTASIAPVDGSGYNGVWAPGGGWIWGIDHTGAVVDQVNLGQLVGNGSVITYGAPAIADLGNGRGLSAIFTFSNTSWNDWYVAAVPIGAGAASDSSGWPTFHGDMQRGGGQTPNAVITSASGTSNTTNTTVSWATAAGSIPAKRYTLWVHEASLGWQPFTTTTATSTTFTGLPGHTYNFYVEAQNALGSSNALKTYQATVTIASGATHSPALPFHGLYAVDQSGRVSGYSSAPLPTTASWPGQALVRAIGVDSDGLGGEVVDAYGGIHAFGNARIYPVSSYFGGWDIIRGASVMGNGSGGYTLDGWGGLHPFGAAAEVPVTTYYRGWDIMRGMTMTPSGSGGYTLDGWGGIHPFGSAPEVPVSTYYQGWDIMRGIAIDSTGRGGYTLDGWGGVHNFGDAPAVQISAYWQGWDIARGIVLNPSGPGGYVLDAFGGVHPFGGAPTVPATTYLNSPTMRGIAVG